MHDGRESEDLGPGSRVGPYEILEVAGQGGMGVVYRARDTRLGREVAIKCPDRELADDAVAGMRFTREARAAARLSHPHIVQVHEVFEHDGWPWLVMQLVRGPTLRKVLDARGALPVPDILRWAEELASALGHAHEQRILHRDIKPGNILITSDGRALLTDFGLARPLPPTSREPPAVREINKTVPVELERVLQKLLAWRPAERYASARALAEDLRAYREKVESTSRRRYRMAFAVSTVLLIAAVGIGVALRRSARQPDDVVATAVITWPSREAEGRISPDKRWLSFLSDRDGGFRVWLRSLEGSLEQPLTAAEESVESHVWSGDGTEIVYLVDDDTRALLRIVPALGGSPRTIFTLEARFVNARLVRSIGARIYIELPGALARFDRSTGELTELWPWSKGARLRLDFDVHPNERRIVYAEEAERRYVLWTSDLDGGGAVPVTSARSASIPHWAGVDGDRIVYTSNRSGQPDLWSVDPDTGTTERITLSPWTEMVTDVSLDGSVLVFVHLIDASHLWTLDRASGQSYQITADTLSDSWTTTGSQDPLHIAFERALPSLDEVPYADSSQILIGRLADDRLRDARVLTPNGERPVLAPNGRWLTYVRDAGLWVQSVRTGDAFLATPVFAASDRRLFPFTWANRNVAWTPSSSAIYFATRTKDGAAVLRLPIEPRGEPETIVDAPPPTLLRELFVSPAGDSLVYTRIDASGFELVRRLDSGDERALFRSERQIKPLGWLAGDTVLVALATNYPDSTQSLEFLAIDPSGKQRRLGSLDRAYADTAVLDPDANALYVTAVTSADVHNIVEIELTDGRTRVLTSNRLPGVSFSAFQPLPAGLLLHARQERSEDIWIVESGRRD